MKKEIFAGLGLGLLIGVIIGLSIAQVTGIILGALTSLLAAFFGLKDSGTATAGNRVIIGTFSISCLCSIFLGLYVRTHDLLSPSVKNEYDTYTGLKLFNKQEVKQILLFRTLGLVPKDYKAGAEKTAHQNSVLMSSDDAALRLCDSSTFSLLDLKNAFVQAGPAYAELANKVLLIPDTLDQYKTFLLIKDCLCKTKN